MEEKEDSSVDINKLVKDFVNMKEITRTMQTILSATVNAPNNITNNSISIFNLSIASCKWQMANFGTALAIIELP